MSRPAWVRPGDWRRKRARIRRAARARRSYLRGVDAFKYAVHRLVYNLFKRRIESIQREVMQAISDRNRYAMR